MEKKNRNPYLFLLLILLNVNLFLNFIRIVFKYQELKCEKKRAKIALIENLEER